MYPRKSANMTVVSMVTARAFMTFENAISQIVQVFGFMRLGLMPNKRNGAESGPRNGIGKCRFCQQPKQIAAGSGVICAPLPVKALKLQPA
ncbi:MAG: hypothetical protein ACJ8FZ_21770 [Bradyrhizobium sp.]